MLNTEALQEIAVSTSGFIFDPRTGASFIVNPSGRVIIEALRNGKDVPAIEAELKKSFEIPPDIDLTRDILEFSLRLRDEGLLEGELSVSELS